jgi:hypothetical protein
MAPTPRLSGVLVKSTPKLAVAVIATPPGILAPASRQELLATKVRQRIQSRLGERIRQLQVTCNADKVLLRGECATYYSKQLAQVAALGVLEDETLDNAIVVSPG